MYRILGQDAPLLSEVAPNTPPAIVELVRRALSREEEGRPASALELRTALEQAWTLPIATPEQVAAIAQQTRAAISKSTSRISVGTSSPNLTATGNPTVFDRSKTPVAIRPGVIGAIAAAAVLLIAGSWAIRAARSKEVPAPPLEVAATTTPVPNPPPPEPLPAPPEPEPVPVHDGVIHEWPATRTLRVLSNVPLARVYLGSRDLKVPRGTRMTSVEIPFSDGSRKIPVIAIDLQGRRLHTSTIPGFPNLNLSFPSTAPTLPKKDEAPAAPPLAGNPYGGHPP